MAGENREKRVVLLVDDQPFFLRYLSDIFTGQQCQVFTAPNGQEGLEQARRLRPDIIILDLEMPILDGVETCKALKADEATRHIPVIILTATQNLKLNDMAFKAGAQATVLKSMSPERLLNMVEVVIRTDKVSDSPRSP
ncbi:MAG: PleD family two-component system response regulator [Candidatus Methylomirabilales bacterium]